MKPISIAIVDDNEIFRFGLKSALSTFNDLIIVGEFCNGKEFIDSLCHSSVEVVLMDIKMPVKDGIETTMETLAINPNLKIIAITMYGEEVFLKDMLKAKANGFLLKDADKETIHLAIKQVYAGNNFFSNELLEQFTQVFLNSSKKNDRSTLSSREIEVLRLVAKGYTNAEISDHLCISTRTVEGHKTNLVSKTGSKNIVSALVYALKQGIVSI